MNSYDITQIPTLIIVDSMGNFARANLDSYQSDTITFGRMKNINDIQISDSFVSGTHGAFIRSNGGFAYQDLDSSNGSMVISGSSQLHLKHTNEAVELKNHSIIRIGSSKNPDKMVLIFFTYMSADAVMDRTDLNKDQILIGRNPTNDIILNHPSVSRVHAVVSKHAGKYYIRDNRSLNGVIVNGTPVNKERVLKDKDVIEISGFQLIFSGNYIYYRKTVGGISISTDGVTKWVGKGKERKCILRDVNIEIKSNEFVAIIGGSGAGKTTLMSTLNGFDKDYEGEVFFNSTPLKENFQQLKGVIGYVPQQDIIYENLTLRSMLMYTAKLRMPEDLDESELEGRITEVLETLDLQQHQDTLIRKLSGGQKKRASIAVELLADPRVFFLDEPTSGLDPGTEKNLMESLRKLCKEQERTIVMVTHTTQSLHLCDKVIFMGQGGRVCFMGSVDEARKFFQTDDLTDIYNMMSKAPEYWANRYRQASAGSGSRAAKGSTEQFKRSRVSALSQFSTITKRYVELIVNDKRKLLILLLEPILIGVLLYIVAEKNVFDIYGSTKSIMFVLSCAAIWIGLFNSIQEICKERSILKREYMANLRLYVYIMSKVVVQAALGLIQAVLMTLTFLGMLDILKDGGNVDIEADDVLFPIGGVYAEIIVAVWITILASMALGLLISSIVKTGDKAMTMAPFILIVQLLFSGILFKLKGIATGISYFTISRWSVDSMGRIANLRELDLNENGLPVPDDTDENMFDWDPGWLLGEWGILIGMAVITIVLSVIILRSVAKDGR
ncbi:MAG: ATP-binding cassette domain-containing protein [Bacillota bacterium]|nr:ATP-binding cassette domain-containing protein [Bacillota bacterium]